MRSSGRLSVTYYRLSKTSNPVSISRVTMFTQDNKLLYIHIDNALVNRAMSRKNSKRFIERRCREPGAKGVEINRNEKDVPVHSRLGSGDRRKLPQRGSGRSPSCKRPFLFSECFINVILQRGGLLKRKSNALTAQICLNTI